jgi:phenylpropionate dioxygenase-like ring-hydroxylating dioxygenase large terminal subunit
MLKKEDNERLTRVGPGTPMGALLRRYWQPALLSSEIAEKDGPPVRIRLLGEDLIAFRDTKDRIGLIDAYCAHRRAPMFYGRNEDCGIRCVYHGWKFDVEGNCVDLPSLPADSPVKAKVHIKSYPAVDKAGVIWAYMGPADQVPPLPDYEWMRALPTHRHVSKNYQECNYLQALEGGLDTAHSSFLHNNVLGLKRNTVRNADVAPAIEVYPTQYGYQYVSLRNLNNEMRYVRVYHYVMPFQQMRGDVTDDAGGRSKVPKIDGHFWVPIDDYQTITWSWMYGYDKTVPITPEFAEQDEKRAGRGRDDFVPGTFKLLSNLSNDHRIDRQLQKTTTFTGITGVQTQDVAIQEGMGAIVDRSKEFLVPTDKAVIAMRRMMLEATYAVERGEKPPGLDPDSYRTVRPHDSVVPANVDWREALAEELVAKW